MSPQPSEDVLVILQDEGAARREMGEEIRVSFIEPERQLHALELRAERDGFASIALWPARFPDFALEVYHIDGAGTSYRQTGSATRTVKRMRALGLLRTFAATLEKGGAA